MMRSMYAAVSSLRAHQTKMDIIGNNIANVNTVGFKASRVTFKETFAQTIKGAGGAQDGRGGTNPMQIGLGADVASIDTIQRRGAVERTDNVTDLMINGEGYFMVSDDVNFLNRYYTRAGNFILDEGGNLVTQDGYKVLGYMADETGRLKSSLEGLKIDKSLVYPPQATKPSNPPIPGEEIVTFKGNLNSDTIGLRTINIDDATGNPINPSDLKPVAKNGDKAGIYQFDPVLSKAAGKPVYSQKNEELNKALGRETTIKVFDDFGNVHQIKLLFTKMSVDSNNGESTWQVDAMYMGKDGYMLADDETIGWTVAADGSITPNTGANGFNCDSFTITFDKNGKIKAGSAAKMPITIGSDLTQGADALNFEIDLGKLTQFSDKSNADASFIKGYKQGSLKEFTIAPNGEIIGMFDNGERRLLGRVAIANFRNPSGLQKLQSNMFVETRNSGNAVVGKPGQDGFAELNPGSLEMSNVDLGQEFTNMITTQRGFQANSRVITTTDQMLEELVNLKR
ncbi:flagellar hook protein FlgE [Tepidibacter thalassicus]|uniref:Flagellar hook protein FlgE n=1 Tax=Tepidibacter thalassicus DSM 15285 TaxID=1123350 RepID=A0A1M5NT56_9FIRM|nr:flagellar hook protein FlgE [Tepidibacter thalassicus]SHG92690.1 flagellar hook protein FlgE [Tepidibacter thalassicus DSM 15285]